MFILFLNSLFFFLINSDDRVKIDIYMESLCPDTINFILTSFEEAINLKDFDKICEYRLYSFGNA